VLERLVLELRGTPCLSLEEVTPDRKSIMASRSFAQAGLFDAPDNAASKARMRAVDALNRRYGPEPLKGFPHRLIFSDCF
jgi:hypothetical protein